VALARVARRYYVEAFTPLSLVFPFAFFLNGFYTGAQGYAGRYKALVIMRGVLSGAFLFALGNYLFFKSIQPVTPSMAAVGVIVAAAAASARLTKATIVGHSLKNAAAVHHTPPTVLVVGGAGYIGSTLVRRLLDKGYNVRILDNLLYGDGAISDILNDRRVDLRVGDCRNIQNVIAAVNGVESIVDLAAIVGDPACELDHQTALEINYAATRMLIEVAKGDGVRRFVFASSCSVYGATETVVDETSSTAPLSVYARTKIDSEDALIQATDQKFHPTILRLATVFGKSYRPRFDLVVNLLTAKAHTESVITIYNGEQWRPFIHVDDVAQAILKVLGAPLDTVGGQIFNVGDSRLNHTLTDVAAKIRRYFPDTRVMHIDNNDRRNYRVSFDKIRNRLGFVCHLNLDYGISELKQAFEDGKIVDYTDVRYHNQRYLQLQGGPAKMAAIDTKVMAAFASDKSEAQGSFVPI